MPQGRITSAYDDRPFSGPSSPWGLDLEVHRHGDEIEALVTLRAAHEGAPGRSHGGIVAGAVRRRVRLRARRRSQQAAFTGELTIRYEQPTPLHRPLACRGRSTGREGRKIGIEGELVDVTDGTVIARGRACSSPSTPRVRGAERRAARPARRGLTARLAAVETFRRSESVSAAARERTGFSA